MHRIPVFIKWLVATLGALALLTGIFFVRGQQQPDAISTVPQNSSTDLKTLLVQFSGDNEASGGVAILVKENTNTLRIFNISPRVAMSFGDAGIMTLAEAGTQVPSSQVADGVSVATGIRIDGTITLQRLAVAGLVDSVGGVQVNSLTGLLVSTGDADPMYVPPGIQTLDGQHAAGYAMVKQFVENENSQVARLNEILAGIFIKVPSEGGKLDETFSALGSLARSDVSTSEIAKFFNSINEAKLWPKAKFNSIVMDQSELELMPDSNWLRVRQPDTWRLIAKYTPKSIMHFSQTKMRVEISSELPLDRTVIAGEITQLGFRFVDGGYAKTPETTSIYISGDVSISDIEALRTKLGLPDSQINWDFKLGEYTDVRIVVGRDYRDQNPIPVPTETIESVS